MTNTIVDIGLSSSAYALPSANELTNIQILLVVAFLAVLMLLVGLMVVWTCLNKLIYRVVFGIMYCVALITAWILSGLVVSMLLYYIKPVHHHGW